MPSSARISPIRSSVSSTPLGLVSTTACAMAARTVDWARPIRSLPWRPRIMNLGSLPLARTRSFLIVSTFHFWDWEPDVFAFV